MFSHDFVAQASPKMEYGDTKSEFGNDFGRDSAEFRRDFGEILAEISAEISADLGMAWGLAPEPGALGLDSESGPGNWA